MAVLLANFTLCFHRVAACSFSGFPCNVPVSLQFRCLAAEEDSVPVPEEGIAFPAGGAGARPASLFQEGDSLENLRRTWTLQDCIDYARENNLQVHTARLDQQSSEVQFKSAKASRWPSLSFSSS